MAHLRLILVLTGSVVTVTTFPAVTGPGPRAETAAIIDNTHLITTPAPTRPGLARSGHHFKRTMFGSLLLVPTNMDIVDQTKLFTQLDPFHEQFIPTPSINAGSLPLSTSFG